MYERLHYCHIETIIYKRYVYTLLICILKEIGFLSRIRLNGIDFLLVIDLLEFNNLFHGIFLKICFLFRIVYFKLNNICILRLRHIISKANDNFYQDIRIQIRALFFF